MNQPAEATTETIAKKSAKPRRKTSRSLALHKPQPPANLEEQIMRAAGDPSFSVTKMREMMTLRREMRIEEAEEQFNLTMVKCQKAMRSVEANANNPQTHSKYATLEAVDRALRPIYVKHGFSLSFNTADCPLADHIRVLCYVSRGLFTRTYQHDVAVDPKGPKGNDVMTKTHAGGSALSYGKRYLELMIFHITIREPGQPSADDDGNTAAGLHRVNATQLKELKQLMKLAAANVDRFCEMFQIQNVEDLPATHFSVAMQQLKLKMRSAPKKEDGNDRPMM